MNAPPAERIDDCPFCAPPAATVFLRNELAYALWDGFPVTHLHALVIPHRHVIDYFALTRDELLACDELLRQVREYIKAQDSSVEGFNLGVNAGHVAGQTIFHSHIHLIPRRPGDVPNPRGGIRHVIPGRGFY